MKVLVEKKVLKPNKEKVKLKRFCDTLTEINDYLGTDNYYANDIMFLIAELSHRQINIPFETK